jgi:hypothetical protein
MSNQPRKPKGTSIGGQFDKGSGGGIAVSLTPAKSKSKKTEWVRALPKETQNKIREALQERLTDPNDVESAMDSRLSDLEETLPTIHVLAIEPSEVNLREEGYDYDPFVPGDDERAWNEYLADNMEEITARTNQINEARTTTDRQKVFEATCSSDAVVRDAALENGDFFNQCGALLAKDQLSRNYSGCDYLPDLEDPINRSSLKKALIATRNYPVGGRRVNVDQYNSRSLQEPLVVVGPKLGQDGFAEKIPLIVDARGGYVPLTVTGGNVVVNASSRAGVDVTNRLGSGATIEVIAHPGCSVTVHNEDKYPVTIRQGKDSYVITGGNVRFVEY